MRNYFNAILFFWVTTITNITFVYTQNALVPDILPSADATALGKYGDFPVSHYTGQANINMSIDFFLT